MQRMTPTARLPESLLRTRVAQPPHREASGNVARWTAVIGAASALTSPPRYPPAIPTPPDIPSGGER
jgi:hypothetical protein